MNDGCAQEIEALFQRAREGDMQAKEVLLNEHRGLMGMILRRFKDRGYDDEELRQVAAIGLLKAIDGYDPKTGYKFSTYAVPTIIGELKRFMRQEHLLHVSRPIQENAIRIRRIREKWQKEKGQEPTVEQLAAAGGISVEAVVLAMESSARVDSLDRPLTEEEGRVTLGEKIPDRREKVQELVEKMAVRQAMATLSPEDRALIELRYVKAVSQSLAAKILSTSQAAISRREKKILEQMRKELSAG